MDHLGLDTSNIRFYPIASRPTRHGGKAILVRGATSVCDVIIVVVVITLVAFVIIVAVVFISFGTKVTFPVKSEDGTWK